MIDIICICVIQYPFFSDNRPDELCKVKVALMQSAQNSFDHIKLSLINKTWPAHFSCPFNWLFFILIHVLQCFSDNLDRAVVLVNNVGNCILNF